jgi:hypothetical protein
MLLGYYDHQRNVSFERLLAPQWTAGDALIDLWQSPDLLAFVRYRDFVANRFKVFIKKI